MADDLACQQTHGLAAGPRSADHSCRRIDFGEPMLQPLHRRHPERHDFPHCIVLFQALPSVEVASVQLGPIARARQLGKQDRFRWLPAVWLCRGSCHQLASPPWQVPGLAGRPSDCLAVRGRHAAGNSASHARPLFPADTAGGFRDTLPANATINATASDSCIHCTLAIRTAQHTSDPASIDRTHHWRSLMTTWRLSLLLFILPARMALVAVGGAGSAGDANADAAAVSAKCAPSSPPRLRQAARPGEPAAASLDPEQRTCVWDALNRAIRALPVTRQAQRRGWHARPNCDPR